MSLYGLLSGAAFFAARPFLCRKYDEGNEQRYGDYPATLPKGAVWIHAVSVGEVQSAYPFVKEIKSRSPELPILLSTITKTGKMMSEQLMGDMVHRIYYPWDAPYILKKALSALEPCVYITFETEIWPEMLLQLQKRGIPSFLVNARLSESSLKKYCRLKRFWRKVIRRYSMIMARTEDDAQRFIRLGADPDAVKVTGDCKVDALIERKSMTYTGAVAHLFDASPSILAGSTHEGEDEIVFDAYKRLLEKYPSLRLVIAPRHPERADSLLDMARSAGIAGAELLSAASERWKVLIIDKIGVLFMLYAHVKAAFIGGSLVPRGGQNIMEPAIWGVPFCQGTDYRDFAVATDVLVSAGLCTIVHDAAEMATFFDGVLRSDKDHKAMSGSFFKVLGGAARRDWEIISSSIGATKQ